MKRGAQLQGRDRTRVVPTIGSRSFPPWPRQAGSCRRRSRRSGRTCSP